MFILFLSIFAHAACMPVLDHQNARDQKKSVRAADSAKNEDVARTEGSSGSDAFRKDVIFPKLSIDLQWDWMGSIPEGDGETQGAFRVQLHQDGKPKSLSSDQVLKIKLMMHMGSMSHGSLKRGVKIAPCQDESGNLTSGCYEVSDVVFTMPGKWDIEFRIHDAKDQTVLDFAVNKALIP